jgi:hypothetical protein
MICRPEADIWEEKSNDVVILSVGGKPTVPQDPLSQEEAENLPRDANGRTALHLAAEYCQRDASSQLEMVKRLFTWRPEALWTTDKCGHSPYLHRIVTCPSGVPEEDDIAFFLKDRIMHGMNRDSVLDLLYGKSVANLFSGQDVKNFKQPPVEASAPHRREEREIHVDLREIQISAPSSSKEDLLSFFKGLKFENILQYVQIPPHPFRTNENSLPAPDISETKPGEKGTGRRDFDHIFDILRQKGVKKVMKLFVDDDDVCPHSDEVIENLKTFKIEVFHWKKMDLSSVVLKSAAAHARTLYLFSSGNHSVLRDWSSCDGLNQLGLVS